MKLLYLPMYGKTGITGRLKQGAASDYPVGYGVEFAGYLLVTQIADASGMGVMHLTHRTIGAVLHFKPDFLVSFTEGHALKHKAVDLLDREKIVITGVIDYAVLHTYVTEHKLSHVKTLYKLGRSRENDVLKKLEVAVVAQRQIGRQKSYLVGDSLETVALAAHDFKDIGILLRGHD